ncbi:MAG: zinc ABC transporter substrate-binding protein [Planctomycetota bacterium]|nr:zinc ABC transporter substrate-binding protein [Planctomycetota bacterium]
MNRNLSTLILVLFGTHFLALLPAGKASAAQNRFKRKIVCSTTQIADFARNIAGDLWQVEAILGPGQDPHTHEVTVANAKLVSGADICFQNGWNLEGHQWMKKLCRDAGKPIFDCVQGVQPRKISDEGEVVNDPHAWFSINNGAKVYVKNIFRALKEVDPENSRVYQDNAVAYLVQLDELDNWIKKELARIRGPRVLATHHDAFGYFAADYDFKIVSLAKWSTEEFGGGASLERRKELIATIRSKGVKAIFSETSINPEVMQIIARETGAKLGGKLYSDAMGGKGTPGETYIGMMRENVKTLVTALH